MPRAKQVASKPVSKKPASKSVASKRTSHVDFETKSTASSRLLKRGGGLTGEFAFNEVLREAWGSNEKIFFRVGNTEYSVMAEYPRYGVDIDDMLTHVRTVKTRDGEVDYYRLGEGVTVSRRAGDYGAFALRHPSFPSEGEARQPKLAKDAPWK